MSPQEKPIDRTARLLDLIPFITTHQGIHIDDLAKEFNVTPEEITKDLDLLFMCGLPSYTPLELIDLNYDGGYVTIRDAQNLNRPRKLTIHETATLLLGLSLLKGSTSSQERKATIDALENKVRMVVSGYAAQFIAFNSINPDVHRVISRAIEQHHTLHIRYLNQTKDHLSERVISPLEIFIQGGREHLLAFCHTSKEQRVFDIANIQTVDASEEPYQRAQRMTVILDEERASVSISYTGSGLNFIEQNPELVVAHDPHARTAVIKFWNTEWLLRSILSFGGTVKISEPKVLARSLAERVRETLAIYE